MAQGECRVDDCGSKHQARGLCNKHYLRWKKHGDPEYSRPLKRDEDEFSARIKVNDAGCWGWVGGTYGKNQYGKFRLQDGKKTTPHRWAYEHYVSEIPDGLHVDHICFNRLCANPDHLRLATNAENARNRSGPDVRGSSGYRNVEPTRNGTWQVRVRLEGKVHCGGTHKDIESAVEAAATLRSRLFGEFAGAA